MKKAREKMTNRESLRNVKSIMYKIISLGCEIYIDDWDEFVVSALVCSNSDCNCLWNNSRTECFFCGTNNYHVYECSKCGTFYSLTNSSKKCNVPNCNGKLIKSCINTNCLTNKNATLSRYLRNKGGVFEKKKAASMLNEMRCKVCGCKSSKYTTKRLKIVDNFDDTCNENDVLYLRKVDAICFEAKHNGVFHQSSIIEEILEDIMNINYGTD